MTAQHFFVAVVLVAACVTDFRSQRIPNLVTLPAAVAALLYHAITGGWTAAGWSLAGWFVGAALFFPIFALRGMGAGDVKLLAAIGAWLGPGPVFTTALATSVAGGVLGVAVALGHGYLRKAIANLWLLLTHWRVTGIRPVTTVTLESARGPRLAYAFPIAIGTVVTLWLK